MLKSENYMTVGEELT